tara:strand:+ start:1579 stop:2037 length:459 start_codon:yes stop_codon:yes gene_type:complete
MRVKAEWGKHTWTFFHCLAEKMDEDKASQAIPLILKWIKTLCDILPCPYCSDHASYFLYKAKLTEIKTKPDLIQFIFKFHNVVNKRVRHTIVEESILENYKGMDFKVVTVNWYNNFVVRLVDVRLLMEKHKRNNARRSVLQELRKHIHLFNI